jgi:hypothetical protein
MESFYRFACIHDTPRALADRTIGRTNFFLVLGGDVGWRISGREAACR